MIDAMKQAELCEVVIPTDRWNIRAISPLDITSGVDGSRRAVVIHPGWGKDPERHTQLMLDLAEVGVLPIGVDTRYGYCDQQQQFSNLGRIARLVNQTYVTGVRNPYFDIESRAANRWELRRPTSLLYLCEQLGIGERTFIGHSEGGRIVSMAALASIGLTKQVITVNAAGSGNSNNGYARLLRSNSARIKELLAGDENLGIALRSALGSVTYTTTHLHRTLKEKQVIQDTNLWHVIDQLGEQGVPVAVLHARDDQLISFEDSQAAAEQRLWVNFQATDGDHSNVYGASVRQLLVETM